MGCRSLARHNIFSPLRTREESSNLVSPFFFLTLQANKEKKSKKIKKKARQRRGKGGEVARWCGAASRQRGSSGFGVPARRRGW
jgi:hypothetical protein